jgi:hypothetical protein
VQVRAHPRGWARCVPGPTSNASSNVFARVATGNDGLGAWFGGDAVGAMQLER